MINPQSFSSHLEHCHWIARDKKELLDQNFDCGHSNPLIKFPLKNNNNSKPQQIIAMNDNDSLIDVTTSPFQRCDKKKKTDICEQKNKNVWSNWQYLWVECQNNIHGQLISECAFFFFVFGHKFVALNENINRFVVFNYSFRRNFPAIKS